MCGTPGGDRGKCGTLSRHRSECTTSAAAFPMPQCRAVCSTGYNRRMSGHRPAVKDVASYPALCFARGSVQTIVCRTHLRRQGQIAACTRPGRKGVTALIYALEPLVLAHFAMPLRGPDGQSFPLRSRGQFGVSYYCSLPVKDTKLEWVKR